MIIFPAIHLYEGKAVRLYKGDYNQMTVYNENPMNVIEDFKSKGCTHVHMVDLEGARDGNTPNIEIVKKIARDCGMFVEIGGGIRTMDVIDTYIDAGVSRVILGTSAVKDENLVRTAVLKYGNKIAVGADVNDGLVMIKGWTEKTEYTLERFCEKMQGLGVSTVICTDISKDGVLNGPNHGMYKELSERFNMDFIASGGVSTIDDVKRLAELSMYGAIIGKAYYTGAIDLKAAIEVAL